MNFLKKIWTKKWSIAFWCTVSAIIILSLIVISGCSSPTKAGNDSPGVTVKNSLWQTVTPSLAKSIARDLTGADLQAYVDNYNATNFDDFLRIYDGENPPSLDDAPPVSVFACNPVTYAVNSSYENISRRELVENAAAWKAAFAGQLLFIDHVPPPPIIAPPPSLYAWYAIYEVDNTTGAIVLEEHCGYLSDESFTGQWITTPEGQFAPDGTPGGGWSSIDAYYQTYLHAYQTDAIVTANNVHVVTRQLYTPPAP